MAILPREAAELEVPVYTYRSASWQAPGPSPERPPHRGPGPRLWIGFSLVFLLYVGLIVALVYRALGTAAEERLAACHHQGTVARADQLHGKGHIYLVQLGPHRDPYTVEDLCEWLRKKYQVDTQILPAGDLDPAAYDKTRRRYISERLVEQVKREHPDLAKDPDATVIAFTDAPMYTAQQPYKETYSWRDAQRVGIISSEGLDPGSGVMAWLRRGSPREPDHLRNILRRILVKNVAVLFWHLPLNDDPGSLLYFNLNFKLPTDDLYESDLDPAASQWGQYLHDPCIAFAYTPEPGKPPQLSLKPGAPIQECDDRASQVPGAPNPLQQALLDQATLDQPSLDQERIQLRLREGLLFEKHSDFSVPGPIPIQFERVTGNGWLTPVAFGMSGSHNYDPYLYSHDEMKHLYVGHAGAPDTRMRHVPGWLPEPYPKRFVDADGSGRNLELLWRNVVDEHYDLIRLNGEVESYLPCEDKQFCYLNGVRDARGNTLTLRRDQARRLTNISGGSTQWLQLSYAGSGSQGVTAIEDSNGRRVAYGYNPAGQLTSVTYPNGSVLRYTYDTLQNLLSVSVANTPEASASTLITNQYDHGKLTRQTLANGQGYTYRYGSQAGGDANAVSVTTPDGTSYQLRFWATGETLGSAVLWRSPAVSHR